MSRSARVAVVVLVAIAFQSATSCNPRLDLNRHLGQAMAANAGWTGPEWSCFDWIVNHESAWDERAVGAAGDYGIPQALPGRKMATVGADWRWNPTTQIHWMIRYLRDRYGTPCRAKAWKVKRGWY